MGAAEHEFDREKERENSFNSKSCRRTDRGIPVIESLVSLGLKGKEEKNRKKESFAEVSQVFRSYCSVAIWRNLCCEEKLKQSIESLFSFEQN